MTYDCRMPGGRILSSRGISATGTAEERAAWEKYLNLAVEAGRALPTSTGLLLHFDVDNHIDKSDNNNENNVDNHNGPTCRGRALGR